MSKEAMKLALEALEYIDLCDNDRDFLHPHECFQLDEAITALREALEAQPAPAQQQEPLIPFLHGCKWCGKTDGCDHEQPAQRKPLPDFSPIFSGIKEST